MLSHLECGHKLQIDASKRVDASPRFTTGPMEGDQCDGQVQMFDARPELVLIEGVWGSVSVFKLSGIAHRVKEQKRTLYGVFYVEPKWEDEPKANTLSDIYLHWDIWSFQP